MQDNNLKLYLINMYSFGIIMTDLKLAMYCLAEVLTEIKYCMEKKD